VPRFRLRYQNHDLEVPPGEFVVGRGADCQLAVDDPLVSRRHASFRATNASLTVEDLGSRNGVKVNGQRIGGATELKHGDTVLIGEQELSVSVVATDLPSRAPRRPAVTMTNTAAEGGGAGTLALLSGVVDKALVMGRIDEAERILTNLLSETLAGIQSGRRDAAALPDATKYALKLAGETGRPVWIDWIFQAHHAAGKVLPASTVDELYALARKVRYPVTPALRAYVDGLRAQADRMTATERFVLQRIEGLVRVLLA
jgi:hypothetical protein